MLTIGELSRRTGVKIPTIRWYEQAGLIDEPGRTAGNQRRYDDADLERLAFIRHARDLGLGIEAIRELIDLGQHPDKPCADADRIAATHLAGIRARIARLKRLEKELARIAGCRGDTIGECHVLAALSDHKQCAAEH
ncbi:MAG: helix-turn-helix domain-containing protein [Rhizobiaceae bacterium]|nr:helix-turn-helix domain-containing protein [Rhizobiaceae bacterium]